MRLCVRVGLIGGFILKEVLDNRREWKLREALQDTEYLKRDVEMLKRRNDLFFRILESWVERMGAGQDATR